MKRILLLIGVLACAPYQPGAGVSPDFASSVGCNYKQVMERARVLKARLEDGLTYTPRVGWDACNLLAHNGKPSRIEYQETATTRYASWWYQTGGDVGLVTLTLGRTRGRTPNSPIGCPSQWLTNCPPEMSSSPWVVTYVGW